MILIPIQVESTEQSLTYGEVTRTFGKLLQVVFCNVFFRDDEEEEKSVKVTKKLTKDKKSKSAQNLFTPNNSTAAAPAPSKTSMFASLTRRERSNTETKKRMSAGWLFNVEVSKTITKEMDHKWIKSSFKVKKWCEYCKDFIFSMVGYECERKRFFLIVVNFDRLRISCT